MKRFRLIALFAAMAMTLAVSAVAAPVSGTLVPKVASFDFLVDYSGSMMQKMNQNAVLGGSPIKMDIAKAALERVNEKIPALNYAGGMHTFAPVGTILPVSPYSKANMEKAIKSLRSDLDIYGRLTPMGDAMRELNAEYITLPRKTAVIMITDGDNNIGLNPYHEANAIYATNPDICIHVISLANTAEGKENIRKIASIRPCSVVVEASDLLLSDAAVDKFVNDVFYDTVGTQTIVLRSVQFAFDSSVIDAPSAAILDEVASMLRQNPGTVNIDGHTCSIGNEAYNQGLSQRRAQAVKTYLSKEGVPSSSMVTQGYGETRPKYDNSTEEGRRLNRRAEVYYQ